MAKRSEVGKVLGRLLAAFDFRPVDPEKTVQVYADALADVPYDALEIAATDWINSEKWFPRVSELRARARRGKAGDWREDTTLPEEVPGIYIIHHPEWLPYSPKLYKELSE